MCLEIYAIDQPVQVVYEEEIVRFKTPFSMVVRIMALVRNTGYQPIVKLNAIYPPLPLPHCRGPLYAACTSTTPEFPRYHRHDPLAQRLDADAG